MGIVTEKIKEMNIRLSTYSDKKSYEKEKKEIIQHGMHSELMINRPDGLDRCRLILRSYDTPQLKEMKGLLEDRGISSELLENFNGGRTLFKFNLTPDEHNKKLDIEKDFDDFVGFLGRYFANGSPVESINFFTKEEIQVLEKWYR